jgi:hypothetical protein
MSTATPELIAPLHGPSRRTLLFCALLGLLAFDLLGLGGDFSRAHRLLRRSRTARRRSSAEIVNRVCHAVNHASVWYPKQVRCLQRSVVTTFLLRRCGVPAQMAVGAQTIPFKAHAWTEVNGHAINERNDVQKIYSVWERC